MGIARAPGGEGERLGLHFTSRGAPPPRAIMQDPFPATLLMSYAPASAIAAHHQLHGPCTVISTGCSAGADAIGQAFWAIQEGRADRMLAGGSDSAINSHGNHLFSGLKEFSSPNYA